MSGSGSGSEVPPKSRRVKRFESPGSNVLYFIVSSSTHDFCWVGFHSKFHYFWGDVSPKRGVAGFPPALSFRMAGGSGSL